VRTDGFEVGALLFYGAAALSALLDFESRQSSAGRRSFTLFSLGVLTHGTALLHRAFEGSQHVFGNVFVSFGFVAFLIGSFSLAFQWRFRENSLALATLPLVLILTLLSQLGAYPLGAPGSGPLFLLHVVVTLIGYAALSFAFATAVMYLLQLRAIKDKKLGRVFAKFPSLAALDRAGYLAVLVGFPALTAGIGLGALYAGQVERSFWGDPKVMWAVLTWLIFGIYLFARGRNRWQGFRAAVLTIVGFLVLVFSYVVVSLFFSSFHSFA